MAGQSGRRSLADLLEYMHHTEAVNATVAGTLSTGLETYDPASLARMELVQLAEIIHAQAMKGTVGRPRALDIAKDLQAFLRGLRLPAPSALPQPTEGLSDKRCIKALYEVALPRTSVPADEDFVFSNGIIIAVNAAWGNKIHLDNVIVLENSSMRSAQLMPGNIFMPLGVDDEKYDRVIRYEPGKCQALIRRTSWGRLHALALEQGFI